MAQEKGVRFQLETRYDGKRVSTVLPIKTLEKDVVLRIRGDDKLDVDVEDLELEQRQICLRRQNMKEEVSASGNKNLYEILCLNMKEVRKKPVEEQTIMIKKAYRSQLLRWHPDKNPENGDNAVCQEIIFAYNILKDPEARAAYNNVADYDKGWCSKARWRAIFKPERYSDEQKKQYRKRMGLLFLSTLLIAGGFGLTFLTAGMAAPVVLGITIGSAALMGGGISSGLRTINRESIKNGCSFKHYFISLIIGVFGGAAIGAGVAGIAAFLGGAAKLAFKAAQLSLERQISLKIVGSCFRGFVNSLTSNLDAIFSGGQKMTWKQFLCHVLMNAIAGGIAGASGGLTENMLEGAVSAEEAAIAFEAFSSNVCDGVEDVTAAAVEGFGTAVIEGLDSDVENKPFVDRIKKFANQAALTVAIHVAKNGFKTIKKAVDKVKCTKGNGCLDESKRTVQIDQPIPQPKCLTYNKHKMKYISKGIWCSKMIVKYVVDGKKKKFEGEGSGSLIWIPYNATNIKVSFEVMRAPGVWCDVKEYDRFKKCWIKPTKTHIFEYDTPVARTYTLDGNLYYEAVMNVTADSNDDINENDLPSYNDLIAKAET
ncbi:uncharacterized protein LOC114526019 isoform X2 [Dendronephthya gigantea]|uniref:uncharacterized protein LOC114526019 isoform X2 n=1 Tax=Dendronephthya gigantea TaxID=151771 RepID=UPI00106D2EDF|nr:uncharacterized protein LOC114526019 isoform X2 [Dendronephthya gigantea]XP_028403312.1 uncharacterized protein LOC114526019 isoform X2 [Dendronephthya gigantea]